MQPKLFLATYVWINPEDYKKYTIIENLVPVFEEYLEFKK